MSAITLKDSSYIHNYAFAFTLTTKLMRENVQFFFFGLMASIFKH